MDLIEHVEKYCTVMDPGSKRTAIDLLTRRRVKYENDLKYIKPELHDDPVIQEYMQSVQSEIDSINRAIGLIS